MKTVVRGLVAPALVIGGNTAHGLTFTATGPGDDTNKALSASATYVVSDLKHSNTSNDPLRSFQISISCAPFDAKTVRSSICKQENKSGEVGREGLGA